MDDLVTYASDRGIGRITLCREKSLNAINGAMVRQLGQALNAFEEDDSALVALLIGQGRAFCAGADLGEKIARTATDPAEDRSRLSDLFLVRDRYKPIVGQVQGHAIGMGLRLTLLCDFVVCGETAQFRTPEIRHGIDGGDYWSLLQVRAGDAFAMEVVGTGRAWGGQEAYDRGLVTRCVPDDRLGEEAKALAELLAEQPPSALGALVETRRSALRRLQMESWMTRARGLSWVTPAQQQTTRPPHA
jgi:enoyl-CoA hydratase/carnithine racemase